MCTKFSSRIKQSFYGKYKRFLLRFGRSNVSFRSHHRCSNGQTFKLIIINFRVVKVTHFRVIASGHVDRISLRASDSPLTP